MRAPAGPRWTRPVVRLFLGVSLVVLTLMTCLRVAEAHDPPCAPSYACSSCLAGVFISPTPYPAVWTMDAPSSLLPTRTCNDCLIHAAMRRDWDPFLFPEVLSLRFALKSSCVAGRTIDSVKFFPRSLTGPVFRVNPATMSVQFLMNNMTSVGYYDLVVHYHSGQPDTVRTPFYYNGKNSRARANCGSIYVNTAAAESYTRAPSAGHATVEPGTAAQTDGLALVRGMALKFYGHSGSSGGFPFPPGQWTYLFSYRSSDGHWDDDGVAGTRQFRSSFDSIRVVIDDPLVDPVTLQWPGHDAQPADWILSPRVNDASPPVVTPNSAVGRTLSATVTDDGCGLAVIEPVAGSTQNVDLSIGQYALGESVATLTATTIDSTSAGSVVVRCSDRLGNTQLVTLTLTSTADVGDPRVLDGAIALFSPSPNPMSSETRILFRMARRASVTLSICDSQGRVVRHLLAGLHGPGDVSALWDARDDSGNSLSPGVYFASVSVNGKRLSRPLIRLR